MKHQTIAKYRVCLAGYQNAKLHLHLFMKIPGNKHQGALRDLGGTELPSGLL